jgi:tetratricopeptide (TPR) repeat protein
MGTDEARFARLVDEAIGAGVLRDDEIISFDHPQLRYVMYQRPRGVRRQELHLKVADHLEALSRDDPARVVAIAHHLRRAGERADPDRVIRACLAAASQAAAVVAWGEAARAYDAAIEAAERSDEGPGAMLALLHARTAYAHWYNHDNPRAREHASAAIEIARPLGELTIWADALTSLARGLWSGETGAWGASFDLSPFDEFLTVAGEREPLLRARVHHVRGTLRFMSTDADRAREDLDAALALATDEDDARVIGEVTFALASVYIADNELPKAIGAYETAYALDSMVGNELHRVSGHRAMATVRWIVGDLDEAASQAQVAMDEGPPIAAWAECSNAAAVAAGVAVAQGRLDDAEEFGETAERLMRWAGYPPAAQLLYPALACARTLRGDFERAHQALDAWAMVTSPGINRFRSLVHAHEGNVDAVALHRPRPPLDRPKSFNIASLAAAIEIGDLLDDIERIAWAAPGIAYLVERGVRFDLGWCSFLPRLAGVAALRLGRLNDATRWLDLAAREANRGGATIEAARVARDQSRLGGTRAGAQTPS